MEVFFALLTALSFPNHQKPDFQHAPLFPERVAKVEKLSVPANSRVLYLFAKMLNTSVTKRKSLLTKKYKGPEGCSMVILVAGVFVFMGGMLAERWKIAGEQECFEIDKRFLGRFWSINMKDTR